MNPDEAKELTALIMAEAESRIKPIDPFYKAEFLKGYFTSILEIALSAPTLLISRFKTENK